MNYDDEIFAAETKPRRSVTVRDVLQVGFRRKKLLLIVFGVLATLALVYAFVLPPKYEAETKILVKRDRMDPLVTPSGNMPTMMREPVTEEELNSEAEILLSNDALRRVVVSCGLDHLKPVIPIPDLFPGPDSPEANVQQAMIKLQTDLKVVPIKKTSVMAVTYRVRNAELAAKVLETLNTVYMERHMAVHRENGQAKFFEEQAAAYRAHLKQVEQQLNDFSRGRNSVRPELVRDEMLQGMTLLTSGIASTRADIAQTENRIKTLEAEARVTPQRMSTSVKRLDNPQLMEQLKSTLLTLELKHTELLSKFQKDFRPVRELEQEIAKTRASIASEEARPLREDTTDAHPTYTLIDGELAKAKAELSGLHAREASLQDSARQYQTVVHELQTKGVMEQDLLREIKTAEESYLLYVQKREDSRIADALDQTRILNVAVAEQPMVPALPVHSPFTLAVLGLLFAGVVSSGSVFAAEYFDSCFHAPHEIETALEIPVLAAVPHFGQVKTNGHDVVGNVTANGNGNAIKPNGKDHEAQPPVM